MTRLLLGLGLLAAILCGTPDAWAQSAPAAPRPSAAQSQQIDSLRAQLDGIEKTLGRPDLPDAALQDLRGQLDPLQTGTGKIVEELEPKLDAVKARLTQLGAKPAANAPPEDASVSTERDDQQRQFDDIDATLKRARALSVQIDQDSKSIVSRRRAQFTRALFAQSLGLLNPDLWTIVIREAPGDARAFATVVRDVALNAWERLEGSKRWLFGGALLALVLAAFLLRVLARQVISRTRASQPSDFHKALGAAWVTIVSIGVPAAFVFALGQIIQGFDLANPRVYGVADALLGAVVRISISVALVRGLLAPDKPEWRLVAVGDDTARTIMRLAVTIAAVISATKVIDACLDMIGAAVSVSIALRGLGALASALLVGFGLNGLGQGNEETADDTSGTAPHQHLRGLVRLVLWATALVMTASLLAGYIAYAAFLADQILWIGCVGAALALLIQLTKQVLPRALGPRAPLGRILVASAGLPRDSLDQIALLLTGIATVALCVAAAMLAAAPWGIGSDDMQTNFSAAFFGFKVGEVTISVASLSIAVLLFALVWAAARAVQRWLDTTFLPKTRIDVGLRNSISTTLGYAGFLFALALGLGYLGLGFDRIAIVAGALSVGIGFGLQSIVNNFVSGLILLWERAIKVGDWVVVGSEQGHVRRINVRSTDIETFDRAIMIVPNGNLVSGVVKNWVRNDRVARIAVPIAVQMSANPEQVRDELIAIARGHDQVVKMPAPQVLFLSMSDNLLKFEVDCFVTDVEILSRVKSELNFAIYKRFKEVRIDITPPAGEPAPIKIAGLEDFLKQLPGTLHKAADR